MRISLPYDISTMISHKTPHLNDEALRTFYFKKQNKTKIPSISISIQHCFGIPNKYNIKKKRFGKKLYERKGIKNYLQEIGLFTQKKTEGSEGKLLA